MNQNQAQTLFESGCFLVLTNLPNDAEFGIDCAAFVTGPKFKGLKFVPPGLHFVSLTLSASSFKQGALLCLKPKSLVALTWNPLTESLYIESDEQASRIHHSPYPLFNDEMELSLEYLKWLALTRCISPQLVQKMIPTCLVSSMSSVSRFSDVHSTIPTLKSSDESRIHFTEMDIKRSWPVGSTGPTVTKYSIDKSHLFSTLIKQTDLMGECQLSFVIFLIGQVYDGFEQWKNLVQTCCQSPEALLSGSYNPLFLSFFETLEAQLAECPADFFADALSSNSFLRTCLMSLAQSSIEVTDPQVKSALDCLFDVVARQFEWDPRLDLVDLEQDDDAPLVVDM